MFGTLLRRLLSAGVALLAAGPSAWAQPPAATAPAQPVAEVLGALPFRNLGPFRPSA